MEGPPGQKPPGAPEEKRLSPLLQPAKQRGAAAVSQHAAPQLLPLIHTHRKSALPAGKALLYLLLLKQEFTICNNLTSELYNPAPVLCLVNL